MTTIKTDEIGTRELIYYDKAIEWRNALEDRYIAVKNNYKGYPIADNDFDVILDLVLNAPEDEKRMIINLLVGEISRALQHLKSAMDTYNKDNGCNKPIESFFYDR